MLTAVVTLKGTLVEVAFVSAAAGEEEHEDPAKCEFTATDEATGETVCEDGPSPIAPEPKEIAWGAGAFVVEFALPASVVIDNSKSNMDLQRVTGPRSSAWTPDRKRDDRARGLGLLRWRFEVPDDRSLDFREPRLEARGRTRPR